MMIREIINGKDFYRILMNAECKSYTLSGRVFDIGSGDQAASYHRFFQKADGTRITPLDQKIAAVNFEKDSLPVASGDADWVLAFNCFEHIFRYAFLISEIHRALDRGGRLAGAVPFLVGYHPDPHDYWRFTSEALRNILASAGFGTIVIRVIGRGPCTAAFSQMEWMMPRLLKIAMVPMVLVLDRIVFFVRPQLNREKFALGLFFHAVKP